MTVAELISALEKMPQDATVVRWWTNNDGHDLLCLASGVRHEPNCTWENNRDRMEKGSAVIVG